MNLAEAICRNYPAALKYARHIEVALSGGLDSVVLLHLLAELQGRLNIGLSAVHVHHGLQSGADDWLEFCRRVCGQLDIPLRWQKVEVRPQGLGVEAAARQARYQIFRQTKADAVATAHHADDQIETFMLAALRGGGLRALAAMPECRPLAEGRRLWRPLLPFSRARLAAYAAEHGLQYIDDPSNESGDYLRNWLRHDGLPYWGRRCPDLNRHVLSGISLLQDELAVLEEIALADLAKVREGGLFDIGIWRGFSSGRRRQALLYFVRQQGLGTPAKASLHDFDRILTKSGNGAAQWRLPKGRIEAYGGKLFPVPDDNPPPQPLWGRANRLKDLAGQDGWQLEKTSVGLPASLLENPVCVRPMASGDVLTFANGRKKAGRVLQECHIPPFLRPYWPVLADEENRCLALAGLRTDDKLSVRNGWLPVYRPLMRFIGRVSAI